MGEPATAAPAELRWMERVALRLARTANETRWGAQVQDKVLRSLTYSLVRASMGWRTLFEGLDELIALSPDRGVLVASNHRSFFDQFAVLLGLYLTGTAWCRQIRFPVRSNFFYEHPLGILVNHGVAGGVMYPPIFRQAERAALNKDAVERITRALAEPGTVIGIHPEGTRGKGPDPYEMLPAQPGIGQIALQSRAIVIPAFVQGLSNDFLGDVRDNWRAGIRRERPVIVVIGAPVDYSALASQKPRPALYKRCADLIRDHILALAPRERTLRAACQAGEIADDDPRWLVNRPHSAIYAALRDDDPR